MKLLKIILPIGILGVFIFMYFFKSKQQDHVFDYLPVKLSSTSNKISLIDYNGNVVAEDVFKATSKIYPTNGVITEETSEGKVNYWVIKNKDKVKLIDKEFDAGTPFNEEVAIVRDADGKLSLINKKGEALIPNLSKLKEFNVVLTGVMSDGLIRFKTDEGKWGYVDKTGNIIITPKFNACENFSNGKARVLTDNNEFKIIDKKGEQLFKGDEETSYLPFSENQISFKKYKNNKSYIGITDFKGKTIIRDDKYIGIGMQAAGLFAVKNDENDWGVINAKEETVGDLRFKFSEAPIISKSGIVITKSGKDLKMYNKKGTLVTSLDDYNFVFPISSGKFVAIKNNGNGKFELINESGKVVGKETYIWALDRGLEDYLNYFESPEVVMNYFTITSTYFDFEKLFSSAFTAVSPNYIAGITGSSTIANVLQLFPYVASAPTSKLISKTDDYKLNFYYPSLAKPYAYVEGRNGMKTETTVESVTEVTAPAETPAPAAETAVPATDVAAATADDFYQSPAPVDLYPYLSSYNSSYTSYKGVENFRYTFNFDTYVKNSYDANYQPNYDLNLNARLTSIVIEYNENMKGNELLKKKLKEKLIASGWRVSSDYASGVSFINNTNQNTVTLTNYGLTFNFYNYTISPDADVPAAVAPSTYDYKK